MKLAMTQGPAWNMPPYQFSFSHAWGHLLLTHLLNELLLIDWLLVAPKFEMAV